jgi:hypothetical protein
MPSDVYSVTWGDLKIIALNTNSSPRSQIQKPWLRQELEKSRARWKLVIPKELSDRKSLMPSSSRQ